MRAASRRVGATEPDLEMAEARLDCSWRSRSTASPCRLRAPARAWLPGVLRSAAMASSSSKRALMTLRSAVKTASSARLMLSRLLVSFGAPAGGLSRSRLLRAACASADASRARASLSSRRTSTSPSATRSFMMTAILSTLPATPVPMRIWPERGSTRPGAAAIQASCAVAVGDAAGAGVVDGEPILIWMGLLGVIIKATAKPARPREARPARMASFLAIPPARSFARCWSAVMA